MKSINNNYIKTALLFALIGFASCNNKPAQEEIKSNTEQANTITLSNEQFKNAGIATGFIETKNISEVLKLNGKIDVPPQNLISVSMPLGGYLKHTRLLPGMHISKGEVLAVMEDRQYIQLQQDFLTAKSQLEFLQNEYNRQKELNESKASSDKVFQQTKADYESQLVLLKSLEQQLKLISINPETLTFENISRSVNLLSPINGFVSSVNINIGKYVTPSDVLFELVNPDDIHLNLTVYEKDINKLAIGQKLYAYTNNQPGNQYLCEIILISKNLGSSNAAEVHCHFKQYDKKLIPGTFMNARVEVSENNSLALPEEAVVRYENKNYIFINNYPKTFEMVEVQTGRAENNYIELLNANKLQGKPIAIKGAYNLLMAFKNTSDE